MKFCYFCLFCLCFVLQPIAIYALEVNHASKVYGLLGTGTLLFVGGAGVSYVAEMQPTLEKPTIHAVTVDLQFLGILDPAVFSFNIGGTYGLGMDFADEGIRLIVDVVGVGLNGRSGYYRSQNDQYYSSPIAFLLNLPGFQITLLSGFYAAWRNNFSVGDFTEFKTYFAWGFDFSKIYNPDRFNKK